MYCPSCGKALSKRMKFCNGCGAKLSAAVQNSDERLDDYLTGLFWIMVFGLGLIVGGTVVMKSVLNLGNGLVVWYAILSSAVFIINFWLNLRETIRILQEKKRAGRPAFETNELGPTERPELIEARPSVTENTTRELEPAARDQAR